MEEGLEHMKDAIRGPLSPSTQRRPNATPPSARGWRQFALPVLAVALLAVLAAASPAHADPSTGAGPFGREVLGNPVPGPVVPAPNVFPLPPPLPAEPGFAPAPDLPGRQTFPVPAPGVGVHDGPGSAPPGVPPVRNDAEKPADAGQSGEAGSGKSLEPVGKLSKVDDEFLERKGVNAHAAKKGAGLVPESRFDIYIDQEGKMYGVAKGLDPKYGEFIGPLPR